MAALTFQHHVMQALPIGIQTFAKIREQDFVYIDKTPLIAKLTEKSGAYFLSRPRRFGKSLLVDTFKELFEGNRNLFKGLYIEDKWDWSQTYPVIHLNFADGDMRTLAEFKKNLDSILLLNQQRLGQLGMVFHRSARNLVQMGWKKS